MIKKLKFEQRIRHLENSTLNPLFFPALEEQVTLLPKSWNAWQGSWATEGTVAPTSLHTRMKIGLALLRSSITFIRGSCTLRRRATVGAPIGTTVEERSFYCRSTMLFSDSINPFINIVWFHQFSTSFTGILNFDQMLFSPVHCEEPAKLLVLNYRQHWVNLHSETGLLTFCMQ